MPPLTTKFPVTINVKRSSLNVPVFDEIYYTATVENNVRSSR